MMPLEITANLRSLFFTMFGGPEKMDCWLSQGADALAQGSPAPLHLVKAFQAFPNIREVSQNPREALDFLLDRLHELHVWDYRLERQGDALRVFDEILGCLLEEAPAESLETIRARYGANLKEG
ncbi:MAG: hypothetical protein FJ135_01880 [Deltaproteobacteria bacterium]|nr:hypothetical protein [Deltaproteobacteria bacterium]